MAQKYADFDAERIATKLGRPLTPLEQQVIAKANYPVTAADIVRSTGIGAIIATKRLEKQLDKNNIDLTSVRFRRGVGFIARTHKGQLKRAYVVQTENGRSIYFTTESGATRIVDNAGDEGYEALTGATVFIPNNFVETKKVEMWYEKHRSLQK